MQTQLTIIKQSKRQYLRMSHLSALAFLGISLSVFANEQLNSYSPYADVTYPRNVYWGDTHLHTNLSADANLVGNKRLGPADAYRFARGKTVIAHNGMPVALGRPLDFLVITDHSDYLGWLDGMERRDELLLSNAQARQLADRLANKVVSMPGVIAALLSGGTDTIDHPVWDKSVWQRQAQLAEQFNAPGRFTALIGYEWTSMPNMDNLHRNVIFRDGADKAGSMQPFTVADSNNPQDLWAYLALYEKTTGGKVLAIPHNSNLSGGRMFPEVASSGEPLSREYSEQRARWEPVVEVTQYKGDSETHPFLSPEDEFADYESWVGNIGFDKPYQDAWFSRDYVRGALKTGLAIEQQTGANPYRFGLLGSTDSHTSFATAEENNFFGKLTVDEPSRTRTSMAIGEHLDPSTVENEAIPIGWAYAASGYAAVWATENTREGIFDAMQRREIYATTGPRMVVRFFGGWQFALDDHKKPDLARTGYRKGVPMGGLLQSPSKQNKSVAPRFLIAALKDPDGANLDRVQVIKGWLDNSGQTHEKVYDVAWSGERELSRNGKLPSVEGTVDIADASYSNGVGSVQLATVWEDPDFRAGESAFYYARVIEIPTPRWTAYDAKYFNTEMPDEVPMTTQERAYTSPIWYQPK